MRGCDTVAIELPGYVDGKLDMATAVNVEAHLRSCDSCRAEVHEIEQLGRLLNRALPDIQPSPGFESRFANLLAAELAREEEVKEQSSWLSWLLQPWLVPIAAAAMLGAIVFAPWVTRQDHTPKALVPQLPSIMTGGVASAKKPAENAVVAAAGLPAQAPKTTVASNKELPKDLIQRPELFVDYAVIRDLDVLESDEGAGKAG